MTPTQEQQRQEIERLIREAPKYSVDSVPHLDHEEAYDFVAYRWPTIKKYLRSLQASNDTLLRENGEMRRFILEGAEPVKPCSVFEPSCVNCQQCKILSSIPKR